MYDKFKLKTRNFNVSLTPTLELEQGKIDLSTGEVMQEGVLFKIGGKQITGKKAYYNSKNFNLTITPYGLTIEFNPSKIGRENNIYTANQNQLNIAIKTIQRELKDIGVKVDILKSDVSRLDLTRDINTTYSINQYIRVLSQLPMATTLKEKEYPTGFLMANTQREYCIYDKLQQIQDTIGINPSQLGLNKPIMRLENRLLNKKVVKSKTGLKILQDFTNIDNYNHCKEVYKQSIQQDVFSIDNNYKNTTGIDTNSLTGTFEVLLTKAKTPTGKELGTIRAIDQLLMYKQFDNLIKGFGDISTIVNKFEPILVKKYPNNNGKVRKEKSKLKKRLESQLKTNFYLNNTAANKTGLTEQDLYFEIKEKFLQVA